MAVSGLIDDRRECRAIWAIPGFGRTEFGAAAADATIHFQSRSRMSGLLIERQTVDEIVRFHDLALGFLFADSTSDTTTPDACHIQRRIQQIEYPHDIGAVVIIFVQATNSNPFLLPPF